MPSRQTDDEATSRTLDTESFTRPVRVGSCELHAELASGGTASVFIGIHRGAAGFEKVVAVKRLLPAFAHDADYCAMLEDEAAISAQAQHPFVRDVFDFGLAEDGTPYAVMEFLFGQPLSSVQRVLSSQPDLARDRLHVAIVARIVASLCEGLHAVHELADENAPLDIVHRDVTPQNLFVLYDGSVRVTDFGIVRARVRKQAPSGAALKGKVPYMSPEYLARKPYDRRSDVWAMGVVLWELLTGSRLFRRTSDAETVRAILTAPVPAPSNLAGDVDRKLDAIVLKALSRDVDARYRTMRELANDLEAWIARETKALNAAEIGAWLERMLPGSRASLSQLVRETRAGVSRGRVGGPVRPSSHPTSRHRPTLPSPRSITPTPVRPSARATVPAMRAVIPAAARGGSRPTIPAMRATNVQPKSHSRPKMPAVDAQDEDMIAFALSRPSSANAVPRSEHPPAPPKAASR